MCWRGDCQGIYQDRASFLVLKYYTYNSSSEKESRIFDDGSFSYHDLNVLTENKIEEQTKESDDEDNEDVFDDVDNWVTMRDMMFLSSFKTKVVWSNQDKVAIPKSN